MDPKTVAAATTALESLLQLTAITQRLSEELVLLRKELEAVRQLLPPTLVTVSEAASRFGVTKQTIRRWIDAKRLKASTSVGVRCGSISAPPLVAIEARVADSRVGGRRSAETVGHGAHK